jgi:hypothetical protein
MKNAPETGSRAMPVRSNPCVTGSGGSWRRMKVSVPLAHLARA